MTFYIILVWKVADTINNIPAGWDNATDNPEHYLDAKARMQRMKKDNPDKKYKLMKTSY